MNSQTKCLTCCLCWKWMDFRVLTQQYEGLWILDLWKFLTKFFYFKFIFEAGFWFGFPLFLRVMIWILIAHHITEGIPLHCFRIVLQTKCAFWRIHLFSPIQSNLYNYLQCTMHYLSAFTCIFSCCRSNDEVNRPSRIPEERLSSSDV